MNSCISQPVLFLLLRTLFFPYRIVCFLDILKLFTYFGFQSSIRYIASQRFSRSVTFLFTQLSVSSAIQTLFDVKYHLLIVGFNSWANGVLCRKSFLHLYTIGTVYVLSFSMKSLIPLELIFVQGDRYRSILSSSMWIHSFLSNVY